MRQNWVKFCEELSPNTWDPGAVGKRIKRRPGRARFGSVPIIRCYNNGKALKCFEVGPRRRGGGPQAQRQRSCSAGSFGRKRSFSRNPDTRGRRSVRSWPPRNRLTSPEKPTGNEIKCDDAADDKMKVPNPTQSHILEHTRCNCPACMDFCCRWRKAIKREFPNALSKDVGLTPVERKARRWTPILRRKGTSGMRSRVLSKSPYATRSAYRQRWKSPKVSWCRRGGGDEYDVDGDDEESGDCWNEEEESLTYGGEELGHLCRGKQDVFGSDPQLPVVSQRSCRRFYPKSLDKNKEKQVTFRRQPKSDGFENAAKDGTVAQSVLKDRIYNDKRRRRKSLVSDDKNGINNEDTIYLQRNPYQSNSSKNISSRRSTPGRAGRIAEGENVRSCCGRKASLNDDKDTVTERRDTSSRHHGQHYGDRRDKGASYDDSLNMRRDGLDQRTQHSRQYHRQSNSYDANNGPEFPNYHSHQQQRRQLQNEDITYRAASTRNGGRSKSPLNERRIQFQSTAKDNFQSASPLTSPLSSSSSSPSSSSSSSASSPSVPLTTKKWPFNISGNRSPQVDFPACRPFCPSDRVMRSERARDEDEWLSRHVDLMVECGRERHATARERRRRAAMRAEELKESLEGMSMDFGDVDHRLEEIRKLQGRYLQRSSKVLDAIRGRNMSACTSYENQEDGFDYGPNQITLHRVNKPKYSYANDTLHRYSNGKIQDKRREDGDYRRDNHINFTRGGLHLSDPEEVIENQPLHHSDGTPNRYLKSHSYNNSARDSKKLCYSDDCEKDKLNTRVDRESRRCKNEYGHLGHYYNHLAQRNGKLVNNSRHAKKCKSNSDTFLPDSKDKDRTLYDRTSGYLDSGQQKVRYFKEKKVEGHKTSPNSKPCHSKSIENCSNIYNSENDDIKGLINCSKRQLKDQIKRVYKNFDFGNDDHRERYSYSTDKENSIRCRVSTPDKSCHSLQSESLADSWKREDSRRCKNDVDNYSQIASYDSGYLNNKLWSNFSPRRRRDDKTFSTGRNNYPDHMNSDASFSSTVSHGNNDNACIPLYRKYDLGFSGRYIQQRESPINTHSYLNDYPLYSKNKDECTSKSTERITNRLRERKLCYQDNNSNSGYIDGGGWGDGDDGRDGGYLAKFRGFKNEKNRDCSGYFSDKSENEHDDKIYKDGIGLNRKLVKSLTNRYSLMKPSRSVDRIMKPFDRTANNVKDEDLNSSVSEMHTSGYLSDDC